MYLIKILLLYLFQIISINGVSLPGGKSECGFPGLPRNGSIAGSGMLYHPGEEVSYNCETSYVMFGPEKRTCLENGTWSLTEPECKENLALGKSALQSATLWTYEPDLAVDSDPGTCSFTPRSTETRWWQVHLGKSYVIQSVAVTISPGTFQRFTIFVIELLEGNKAMYKPCSKFEGKFEAEKIIFLCNDGDGHPGQFVYIRDDREEQEYLGICEVEVFEFKNITDCGDPEQPVSSIVNRQTPNRVEYSCVKGYRMEGNSTRDCTMKGRWSGASPRCIEVQCSHPTSVRDGFIEVSNFKGKYVYGSLATYHCNPGYILWGNASRLCDEDGEWTGMSPTCKPITCGQPPEVLNARFTLVNGSTSWQSRTHYTCKPGFKMIHENKNVTHVASTCSETGIWNPVSFACLYDPVGSLNLKKAKSLGEWADMGLGLTSDDGSLNVGTVAIISVLSVLIVLVIAVVVIFFTYRRSDEDSSRKVSRSSTNQLIADAVAAASIAHAPSSTVDEDKPDGHYRGKSNDSHDSGSGGVSSPNNHYGFNGDKGSSMSTFRPHNSPLPIVPPVMPQHSRDASAGSSSIGGRSAGDGGSCIDDPNYATLCNEDKRGEDIEDDEDSSHYTLIRKPDGRADEPNYSTLSRKSSMFQNGDDPGYESLRQQQQQKHVRRNESEPNYASLGIDAPEVREQVYETLRKNSSGYESMHRSISSGTTGSASLSSNSQSTVIKNGSDSPGQDIMALYATVDPSKKKKNRESGSSLDSICSEEGKSSSPNGDSGSLSPTKSLIQKFNSIGEGVPPRKRNIIKISSQNSLNHPGGSDQRDVHRYATVDRATRFSTSKDNSRLLYSLKSADV